MLRASRSQKAQSVLCLLDYRCLIVQFLRRGCRENMVIRSQVGCAATGMSEIYTFRTAQALAPTWKPYKIAMWADVGQTFNSSITLEHMVEADADVSILIGDLTYSLSLLRSVKSSAAHGSYGPRCSALMIKIPLLKLHALTNCLKLVLNDIVLHALPVSEISHSWLTQS